MCMYVCVCIYMYIYIYILGDPPLRRGLGEHAIVEPPTNEIGTPDPN